MPLPPLFLCRHGETQWNADGRIQGQVDVPLNALGREQAARNGALLRDLLGEGAPGWRFLASPLGRTRETMEILRHAIGLPIEGYDTDARLMELNFGDWQHATLPEIEARTPGVLAEREAAKWRFVPPGDGAESYAMLAERMRPVFEGLGGPTIVVAHGGVARCFLHLFAGMAADDAAHAAIAQDRVLDARSNPARWI